MIRNASCRTEVKIRITHGRVTESVANALFLANFIDNLHPLPVLPMCERIRHNLILYSATNGKDRKQDGSVCIYKYESMLHFGSILQFCFAKHQLVAVIRVFKATEQSILNSVRTPTLPDKVVTLCSTTDDFIFCANKLSLTNRIVAIPASSITLRCVHIPTKGSPQDLIITIPNMFEYH